MAGFTLEFIANTTGDHYVCYRDTNTADPYTCITVNVTTLGPETVEINIPNNIYCDNTEYEGYIVAACQDQTDANTDGVPDTALTFNFPTIPQEVDPCTLVEFTCNSVDVAAVSMNSTQVGSGYVGLPGDPMPVTFSAPPAPGVTATGTATVGLGIPATSGINNPGAGYSNGNFNSVPVLRPGQIATDGAGLLVDVVISGGVITSLSLNTPGSAYTTLDADGNLGNYLTLDLSFGGGGLLGSPTTEALLTFTFIAGFADSVNPTSFVLTGNGSGYDSPATVSFGANAIPATPTITMGICPVVPLAGYVCQTVEDLSPGNPPELPNALGDTFTTCVDVSTLGTIPSEYNTTTIGNCKCEDCQSVTFDCSPASVGSIIVNYNRCSSNGQKEGEVLVVREISAGVTLTDIDCVIPGTVHVVQNTLDHSPVITYNPCP